MLSMRGKVLPDMPYGQLCPNCGSKASHLLSGRELFVEYYEGIPEKGKRMAQIRMETNLLGANDMLAAKTAASLKPEGCW